MGKIMGIISVWLLVISLALPGIAPAATLTLIQGGMRAEAEYQDSNQGGPVQYAYPSASVSISPGYSTSAYASASSGINTSGALYFSLFASGTGWDWDSGVWSEASTSHSGEYVSRASTPPTGFILFRVNNTEGENINYGQLNYSYGWNSSGSFSNADSFLAIAIEGVIELPEIFNAIPFWPDYPGASVSGSTSGVFDVTAGDIIGISMAAGGDMDGYGWYESSCSASFSLTGFGFQPVPLPPTVFLLGSGLLGLAGWRRFRKG